MSLKQIENIIEKKINDWSIKYSEISHTKNIKDESKKAYDELKAIKDYIEKRLNIKTPRLLSNSLIYNKIRIQETTNQNNKEIEEGIQCLKLNNTMFIDKNFEFEVIGFNRVPFTHFKFVAVNIGKYKLTILEDFAFAILYDFEENYSYPDVKKYINIIGTPLGEPNEFFEDKYIRLKGDFENDKHSMGLVNKGPHFFQDIQFYTGDIEIEITGDFGLVSYYVLDLRTNQEGIYGYMGGQKRLIFSDTCLMVN